MATLEDFKKHFGGLIMSEITGKVKEIFQGEVGSGRNQGDAFYSITLEENPDEKLTIFEEDVDKGWIEGLEQGKLYIFTVKKTVSKASGKEYINIVGQTVPCEDVGGDMREPVEEEKPKKLVKVAIKRKPPVVTSNVGGERVFKNKISALQAAVNYVGTTYGGTATDKMLEEYAEKFFKWINE